jgi:hypothetical protein
LLSANESFARAEEDIVTLTGVFVSHSSQQRLVQSNDIDMPVVIETVDVVEIDGGKVRLRTAKGEPCEWRDYKAVSLPGIATGACFRDNEGLVDWINQLPLDWRILCLGDGHEGIWNLFSEVKGKVCRWEILDWYHLVENLYRVGGSLKRLQKVESLLWQGEIDAGIAEFEGMKKQTAINFVAYLRKHYHRIPNYKNCQQQGITIGSGSVESGIKQIGRRIKISGAQWKAENVPAMLRLRCAYLNGEFTLPVEYKHSSQR